MLLEKTIEKFMYLDFLIRMEKTGSAPDLAEKLGVSERTAFNYINNLRELGASVKWSAERQSYIYKSPKVLRFGFVSDNPPEQIIPKTKQERLKFPGRREIFINTKN